MKLLPKQLRFGLMEWLAILTIISMLTFLSFPILSNVMHQEQEKDANVKLMENAARLAYIYAKANPEESKEAVWVFDGEKNATEVTPKELIHYHYLSLDKVPPGSLIFDNGRFYYDPNGTPGVETIIEEGGSS
ncbi:hypothetical protein [Gracilibacillus dipsosauri]|uniref:Uncharacterized protein n=1 Tax=Gracilibacillus dipsosauri TaxID=178340 RepID=A0A317KY04_9BACI|nr:hypothetical protein [Gracilibacillus dipsosauri]PWU68285.1 hypothetical protein DLJ74_07470 [Gracilibacillus dipsosauri]